MQDDEYDQNYDENNYETSNNEATQQNEQQNTHIRTEYLPNEVKTREFIKDAKKIINGKPNFANLDENVQQQKNFTESMKNISEDKKKLYDTVYNTIGINLYKITNKQELKKAYKQLETVKKDVETIEDTLNGKEVYKIPISYDESLLKYFSSIDPKRKGLKFKEQEIKDLTILFNNKHNDYKFAIKNLEQSLSNINSQLNNSKDYSPELVKDTHIKRINTVRKIDAYNGRLKELEFELNNYILEHKKIKNDILKKENIINDARNLITVVDYQLSIFGAEYLSNEDAKTQKALTNLEELQITASKIKDNLNIYISEKDDKVERISTSIDRVTKDDNGDTCLDKSISRNAARLNESSSIFKSMRESYFKDLGF